MIPAGCQGGCQTRLSIWRRLSAKERTQLSDLRVANAVSLARLPENNRTTHAAECRASTPLAPGRRSFRHFDNPREFLAGERCERLRDPGVVLKLADGRPYSKCVIVAGTQDGGFVR